MNFLMNLFGGTNGQIYIYLALVLGSFGGGFYIEHLRFSEYRAEVAIAGEKQTQESAAKEQEQQIAIKELQNEYEAKLSANHNYLSRMLDSSPKQLSSLDSTTITINGTTKSCMAIATDSADDAQQIIALQDYINNQLQIVNAK
jgi:hypothetical protein